MATTETNIHALWAAWQSAQGVPATVATQRFKYVAGDPPNVNVDQGSVPWSDGGVWGGTTQYLNSILGQGTPSFEGGTDQIAWILATLAGSETVTPSGTNEIQTLTVTGTPTGGSIPLTYGGRATSIAFNSTASAAQTALEGLPNIGVGNCAVAGGPLPGTALTFTFQNALQKRPVSLIVASSGSLTGGTSPTATVTRTTPGVLAKHTTVAGSSLGKWTTWWVTTGSTSKWQLKYNDARIGGLTMEASSGTKDLRFSPQILALDPGEVYSTDPTVALPSAPVFLFTEGTGAYKVDGGVIRGLTQFNNSLSFNLSPLFGDATTPFDLARGTPAATVTGSMIADDTARQQWNLWAYGTANPSPGTKPLQRVAPVGSFDYDLVKKDPYDSTLTIGELKATFTVQWTLPNSVAPDPNSGSAEIPLNGTLQPLGALPLYQFDASCQQAAFTG